MTLAYNVAKFLYYCSTKLPDWLFVFNQGTVYFSRNSRIRTRENSCFTFSRISELDLVELSALSGYSTEKLQTRLDAGDIGIISRSVSSHNIATYQWSHVGPVYIRGFNLTLNSNEHCAYFYWAFSAPDVRITGIINSSFQNMIDMLKENNIDEYSGLVEFWNLPAHKFHQGLKYEEKMSVLYIKILFLRLTFKTDAGSGKISCEVHVSPVRNIDII
jgi:hypothetical protein